MNLKARAKAVTTYVPALYLAARRTDTPFTAKALAILTVAYALSPIDLIPDFIPVLGYLDDLLIVPALILLTVKLIPENILAECRAEAEGMWTSGKPKKWRYALPIIAVYALLLWWAVSLIR